MPIINLVYEAPHQRTPGANTLAYRPLKENLNDYSGRDNNFSVLVGSVSYSNNMATVERVQSSFTMKGLSGDFTILAYTSNVNNENVCFNASINSQGYPDVVFGIANNVGFLNFKTTQSSNWITNTTSTISSGVHLLVFTKSNTNVIGYVDGVLVVNNSGTYSDIRDSSNMQYSWLGRNVAGTGLCTYGNLIIENKARTAQEVADYYNLTKSNYGL